MPIIDVMGVPVEKVKSIFPLDVFEVWAFYTGFGDRRWKSCGNFYTQKEAEECAGKLNNHYFAPNIFHLKTK